MNQPPGPAREPSALDRRVARVLAERYRIEGVLGHGGMAVVYSAEDLKHARRVAIKVVDPAVSVALGPERFLREIHLAASLQHPNILPLFDSGEADDLLYYVMPLVEGPSLRGRLTREGRLPIEEAIRITREVASALDHAHAHGVVHRDIKPENILLDNDRPVVADFGIAKSLDAASESLTATGVAVGTPAYMSPEQSTGEHFIDGRSDTYSLACVSYELLAGEPPFTGATAQAVIAKRLAGPAPSLRILRDSVPVSVDRAIARALARTPADRFATSGEFARALRVDAAAASGPRTARRTSAQIAGAVIVASVGAALWVNLSGGNVSSAGREPRDATAAALVTRAAAQGDRRSIEATQRAIQLYQQAIARDSDYAAAWAGLARSLQHAHTWRYPIPGLPADSVVPLMVRAGNRAVELDSTSASALIAKAQVLRVLDPTTLGARFEMLHRALRFDSTSADAWYQLARLWQDSLELHRAIDADRRATTIRPTHANALAFMSLSYSWLDKPDSALIWADSAARVEPANTLAQQAVGFAHRGRRDWDAARRAFEAVVLLGSGSDQTFGYAGLAEIAWRRNDRHAADTLIARAIAGVDTLAPALHYATYLAWAFAETGQQERALRLLERYEPNTDAHFQLHLQREPMLDRLRDLPRFRALLRRVDSGR